MSASRWVVEPTEIHAASSSLLDDARLYPPGSATLDCALLGRVGRQLPLAVAFQCGLRSRSMSNGGRIPIARMPASIRAV
jgi:hypothetical protein